MFFVIWVNQPFKLYQFILVCRRQEKTRHKIQKRIKRRATPEGRGPSLWPLSFLESMRGGMEYPAQNPDRQTMEQQL